VRKLALTCVMLNVLTGASPLLASQPLSKEPGRQTGQTQAQPPELTLTEQIDLARLVDMAAQRLKLNIEYDAAAVKGTATLRLGAGVTDAELWELANQLLASRGFTTIRAAGKGGTISVVKLEAAAGIARLEPDARDPAQIPAGFASVLYRLKHRTSKDPGFIEAVKGLLSKPGGAASSMGDQALIVSDLTPRLDQAMRLIELLDIPGEPMTVTEVPAENLSAIQLVAVTMQLMERRDGKGTASLLPSPDGRSVLVIAPESRHQTWKDALRMLDKREPVAVVSYIPRYFELKEVAHLIEETIKVGGVSGPGATSVGTPSQPASGSVGAGAAGDDRFRVVQDDLTGSLLVTATASQHEQVAALIEKLNASPPDGRRPPRILKVRNRPVEEVLGVLRELVASGSLGAVDDVSQPATATGSAILPGPSAGARTATSSSTGSPTSTPTPGAEGSGTTPGPSGYRSQRTDPRSPGYDSDTDRGSSRSRGGTGAGRRDGMGDLSLSLDKGTSSIIAVGDPRVVAQLEQLIKLLDVRQPQVMVQALVVNLSESDSRNLGIELEGQINLSGDSLLRLSSLFGLSAAGSQIGNRTASGGGTGLLLSPGEFAAVIRAIESLTKGRSVSVPQVLVSNNEQAVFNSVIEQPYATRTDGAGEDATTSFGGVASAGTVITAKPQIGEGDHLLLQFTVELSSFVGQSPDNNLPPPKQTNNVSSSVTLPDGYTVAVGGLELTSQGDSVDQIPLLSSIPILGELFKNRTESSSKSKFYVFLRADVLRRTDFEDLKYLSGIHSADAEIDDGFPDLEPRMIR